MECKECHQLRISIYAHDYDNKNNPFKKIGTICPHCDPVEESTGFFHKLKEQRRQKKKEQEKEKPNFSPIEIKDHCYKCKSKRIKIRKSKENIKVTFDKGQNSWSVNKNNPSIHYECTKCGNIWSDCLPMPQYPKYSIPTKMTKLQLRLALQTTPREEMENLVMPKNLIKMKNEILKELEQERNAKELRESGEKIKRKS